MARIDWRVLSGPRVSRRSRLAVAGASPLPSAHARRIAAQGEPKPGGTLKFGFGISQIPNLDPAKVNLGLVAGGMLPLIFSSLLQFDSELGLVADLAEDWTVSEDGLNY